MQYLKFRAKNYVAIIIGLLIGFTISQVMGEGSGISTAITVIGVGLVIGELFISIRWFRRNHRFEDN
ncbi:hypothetical protein [Mesobacillus maritimus]|uniref:Uncharacterized protein n=1 Tax=Mesobacillus maritimus TaxID=1643336 RepID=A0ABS7KB23_9BACI|nr:hypothetical protein [Mesobacillus maritimus]MBY0099468.1 hypothetical protein [Mesobacillus maritimus]